MSKRNNPKKDHTKRGDRWNKYATVFNSCSSKFLFSAKLSFSDLLPPWLNFLIKIKPSPSIIWIRFPTRMALLINAQ